MFYLDITIARVDTIQTPEVGRLEPSMFVVTVK